jgi:hypothetical protein
MNAPQQYVYISLAYNRACDQAGGQKERDYQTFSYKT